LVNHTTRFIRFIQRLDNLHTILSKDEELLSGEIEMDESYFGRKRKEGRGRGAKDKIPVEGRI